MLRSWKQAYLKSREDIEISGKGKRWEFDQKRLFQGTEYIASVCNGLNQIANVLQDFHNIFGPHLKSIISDPAQIDTVIKRVDRLVLPILNADYNIFDEFNKENWEATLSLFFEEVHFLENEAKFFLDECFHVLISAESALEVLMKFKDVKTRASIHQQLMKKFDVVMQQFSKEVSTVEGIFNRGKGRGGVSKIKIRRTGIWDLSEREAKPSPVEEPSPDGGRHILGQAAVPPPQEARAHYSERGRTQVQPPEDPSLQPVLRPLQTIEVVRGVQVPTVDGQSSNDRDKHHEKEHPDDDALRP